MRVLVKVERGTDLFILLEDEFGQYLYTQKSDDAHEWGVFQEMTREHPKYHEIIFTVNAFLEETGDRT